MNPLPCPGNTYGLWNEQYLEITRLNAANAACNSYINTVTAKS